MKNLFILLIGIILFTNANAQPITISMAKEIARNHLQSVGMGNLKSASINRTKFQFSTASIAKEKNDTLYFVLNDTINKGFVIVSADKRAYPILGYSLEGNFDEANQPPAFVEWMENRKQEIAYIKENVQQADSKTAQQWDNLSSTNYSETATTVGPLLQTTWNQSQYYNDKCPEDANSPYGYNGRVPTGCVATSMAQVMKYWNYPTTGNGVNSYTPSSHPEYGVQAADFGATTYDWTVMPNSLTSPNNAVATLIYHSGVAVNMDYDPEGSGAGSPRTALVSNFKYSSDATNVNKSSYTESNWINLLKSELDSHRPIWYRGDNGGTSGHAFVCDGYQNLNYFHFNWGWGGYLDNYFLVGSLTPGSKNYSLNQGAIIKVFPAKVPDAIGPITGLTEVCAGFTGVTYTVPAIPNAASYTWTLPSGATGTSSYNSITVNFGVTALSGNIKVKAQNSLGTTTESSLAITVNALPAATGVITGKTMVCSGVSETYSIAPVSGAVYYTWEIPAGWTGSSTSTSIRVTPGSTSGTIKVKANSAKCSGTSSSLLVAIGVPITPTSVSASLTTITPGQTTSIKVNGGALNSAPNWEWYTGSCGGTQVGTGSTITVSPTTTTTYYVQATGCGVSTTCKSITITYCSAPAAPASSSASIGSPSNGTSHKINFSVESVLNADGYSWDYSYDGTNWVINWFSETWLNLYWDLGDKPNTPVYFRVRAYSCTPKQYSNYTYTSPKPIYTACDVPASPTVNGATSNSLNLTLNAETPVANPAITTYSIYCTTTSQYLQSNGALGSTEVFQTKSEWGTKTITGLSGNTKYCFYAKARNNDGDIRFNTSNSACGTTTSGICTTPGTPVSVSGTATGQTTASLSWSAGSPTGSSTVTFYWVVGTSSSVSYGNGVAQGSTTGTSASVTGLVDGTTYYLRVYAVTSCNSTNSGYGPSSAFKTNSYCIAPTSPTSATASQTTITSGQSTTLQVVGGVLNSAPNWAWYTGSCGGTQVGSGTSLLVSPTVTTTYFVQASACGITTTCRSVTISVNTNFTISTSSNPIAGGATSGSGTYQSGQSRTVTATANSGYTFSNWTESGSPVSINASYTFTLSGNRTLVANFIASSTPTITISATSLPDCGDVSVGQNSIPQSYIVSGSYLLSNITISAPSGFQISTSSSSGFGSTLTLVQSGVTVSGTPIYVRFSPSSTGVQSGNISHTSTGAIARYISVSGKGSITCTPVNITTQPQNQSVNAGSIATFSVTVSGVGPFSYYWYKNDNIQTSTRDVLSTSSSFTTPILNIGEDSYYYCLITNCNYTYRAESNKAYLTINDNSTAVSITSQPSSQTVTEGSTATFSISANGTAPYTYNWYKNGVRITTTYTYDKSNTYITPTLSASNNGDKYYCHITTSNGTYQAQSNIANLTVASNDLSAPQLITFSPNGETIMNNHPIFKMSFNESLIPGAGGSLKVYKLAAIVPVLTIPITSAMISGNVVTVNYNTTSGLDKNTRYYVLVDGSALKDNAGNAFAGVTDVSAWNFKTGAELLTGIDSNQNSSLNFNVYPSPVTNELTIEIKGNTIQSNFEIINSSGQVIFKGTVFEKAVVQTSSFTPGVYLIKLKSGNTFEFKKIIKY
ncbi:MAG: C10 family peptidase [Bacteroidota bacterium]|nr:C10 family peptidase [Bacteroidota bacterium]